MVMADSAATRVDLMRLFGVGAERITVVYPGVTGAFRTFATDILDKFRRRVMHGRPYFVHVGTLEPRKNLTRLVEAFAALKRDIGIPHALALVGGKGWMYDGLLERVRELGLDNDVVFPGFAAPEELPLWYAAAEALVYPSLYEGFGFPVVEAMACGTPVICSNVSSLPEVAGDAAVLVDPDDVRALTNSMRRVFDDRLFRQELVRRGLERARAFTWEATALGVQEAYRTFGASACK